MANGDKNGVTIKVVPYWLPDTQGFLAIAIILLMAIVVLILLNASPKFDDKTAGVLMTVLGVLTACLKDVYSYFFGSSKGDEKKGDVISTIAATAPLPQPPTVPTAPTVPVPPWWSRLEDGEKNAITAAGEGPPVDPRIKAFVTASQVGAATPDDLAYLVSKGLLTQERSDLIKAP